MTTKQGLLALAVAIGAAGAAQAATITNGSFETNDYTGSTPFTFVTLGTGDTSIDGWTVTAGSVDLIDEYWEDDDGEFNLDLAGNEPGTISTTITGLVAGTTYEISFDTAGNPDGAPSVKGADVTVGLGTESFTFDTAAGPSTLADMNWTTQSFTFTASADGSVLLSFSNTTPGPYGFALDNVSIAAVPLPAAGLMLLAGLGGLAALRRRKTA